MTRRILAVVLAFAVGLVLPAVHALAVGTPSPTTAAIYGYIATANGSSPTAVRALAVASATTPTDEQVVGATGDLSRRSIVFVAADTAGTTAGDLAKSCLGPNSFTGDTPVTMANGSQKPIKDVKVGDKVLATDPETGQTEAEPVVQLIRHSGQHAMVLVTLADGSVLDATGRYKIWDATQHTFVDADQLVVGDKTETDTGALITVAALTDYSANLTVYNLQIDQIHTYYAGTTPVLVHNSCSSFDDALATNHGVQRLAQRGFDSVDIAIVRSSPTAYEQADGAIAHVGQLGPDSYNVIVTGENGVVTGMRGVSGQELNNLARNYGWSGYP